MVLNYILVGCPWDCADWEFFLNVSFLFINFFILIFLACDIKKKQKEKKS